jgi:uncharacterized protein (TIGR02246 family)
MNRNMKLQLAALLILAAGQASAQNAGGHTAEAQAIRQNEARWNREFQMREVERIVAHYADDAVMAAPGYPAFSGKPAIRAAIQQMAADPAMTLKFETARVEVGPAGDMASSTGTFVATMTDPATNKPVTSAGNYVTVYRKQAGEWRAVFDIATPGPDAAGGQKQ